MSQRPSLAIIGPGVVGSAIARVARRVGYRIVAIAGGSHPDHSRQLAEALGGAKVCGTAEAAAAGQLVLLTVKDAAIELLCRQLATAGALNGKPTVAHCSGALSADALAPAREAGCAVGSFHPLQTFPDIEAAIARIPGTHWFIEGDGGARSTLEDLARAMGGYPQALQAGKKPFYHAAAVFSANYLTTLLDIALELYGRAGIDRDQARRAMAPIVRATVENVLEHDTTAALSGPIARGDVETVRSHLEAIAGGDDALAATYRTVGLRTIELARQKGTLEDADAEALRSLLR